MRAASDTAVIEFPRERVRPAAGARATGQGEVVIFTGVRVERLDEVPERRLAAGEAEFR